jgi:CBS-domain-containing membrane protein
MLKISDVMTRDVFTLSPQASAEEAAWALAVRGISGAPVRDSGGRLLGVISRTDLTDPERRPIEAGQRTVGELMTPGLLTLRDSDLAMNAVRLMVREEVHRIIILDDDGELAGIVTPTDVLRAMSGGAGLDQENEQAGPVTIH